jgi:Sulfotransferase family
LPPLVEIIEVSRESPRDLVSGSWIDTPAAGSGVDRTTIDVSGWVVGRHSPVRHVEVLTQGSTLRTIPLAVPRPDVLAIHPPAPEVSGFWALMGTVGLEPEFSLQIRAVFDDDEHADIGFVRGRRRPIGSQIEPRLRPLMVTSLGRTGTTLLMSVLSGHRAVVTHETYPYEIFPAKYWLHMLRVLAEPANNVESSEAEDFSDDIWRVGHNPFHTAPITDHPDLVQLLGRSYVERLAAFCQRSIDDFYSAVARSQGKSEPEFFAEKFFPSHVQWVARDLYPDAREIVLVRDLRDVICSIFAFNAKRKTAGFGRDRFTTDEDYVRFIGSSAEQLLASWKSRSATSKLVHYEHLVRRPAETLQGILDYLGLERKPETIENMLRRASANSELDYHRTSGSAEESIGRWRRELPPSLRPVCEEALGDVLAEFGYDDAVARASS